MTTRTLEELERTIGGFSTAALLVRYETCCTEDHLWQVLEAPELTAHGAEWCSWCLRLRTRCFEGWLPQLKHHATGRERRVSQRSRS
jgi:hypothetical protein